MADQNTPAPADLVEAKLHWPQGKRFTFHDDGGHDPCYIVMPDGAAIPLNHWDDETTDIARAKWIIAACNAALDQPHIANNGLTSKTDDDGGSLETIIKTADRLARRMGGRFVVKSKPADLVEAVKDGLRQASLIFSPGHDPIGDYALAAITAMQAYMASDGVTQMDRDAAAKTYRRMCDKSCEPYADAIIDGERDDMMIVREFTAHRRTAAITPQPDPRDQAIAELREALRICNCGANARLVSDIECMSAIIQVTFEGIRNASAAALAKSEGK